MKGVVASKSQIDSAFKLFVVYSDYEKYDVFLPLFNQHGHGFMEPGKKNIWIDGESLENLTMDHLLAIQAHEIAHYKLKHKGEYSMKQEIEADVEGYKILKKLGHLDAAELLKARIKEMGGSKELKEINESMRVKRFGEFLNESTYYPYQIDDKRGEKLYDKYDKAMGDNKWADKVDLHQSDNYEQHIPLGQFLKKSGMTIKELKELEEYCDESWGLYIDENKNMLYISHD